MLALDFSLAKEWNDCCDSKSIADMAEVDLRYSVACGDFIMVINGVDCSAMWGWIPMVDMAVALSDIRDALSGNGDASEAFEFTENEATITFLKIGEALTIVTSYGRCEETVPFSEFDSRVQEFRDRVFREVAARFPSLELNEAFRSLRG